MITGVGNKASNYTETDVALVQLVSNEIWNLAKRRRVLTDLAHKEQLFRATFEQAAVGLAQVLPQGDFLQINQRFCQIVGYSEDELMSLTFQHLVLPEDLEGVSPNEGMSPTPVEQLLQNFSHTESTEKRYIRQDGSRVWVNMSVAWVCPLEQSDYFIVAIEDISQRKQAEFQLEEINQNLEDLVEQRTAALLEREARYRALMDQASDAIILADLQGVCLETNQQAENLSKFSLRRKCMYCHTYKACMMLLTGRKTLLFPCFIGTGNFDVNKEYSRASTADDFCFGPSGSRGHNFCK